MGTSNKWEYTVSKHKFNLYLNHSEFNTHALDRDWKKCSENEGRGKHNWVKHN
jgi:hypothetical protein